MRKTLYVVTFVAAVATLILNILSTTQPDWIAYRSTEVFHTRFTWYYGLNRLCELKSVNIPDSDSWTSYGCRKFPVRKQDCAPSDDDDDRNVTVSFCDAWTSAGYAAELGIGFASVSLIAILVGVSTHSRRRRIWRAVAALVGLHTVSQIITFAIITHLYRTNAYPTFEHARLGVAYVLNTLSWILGVLITTGVIVTGIYADKGHKWAAGNRAYRRIDG